VEMVNYFRDFIHHYHQILQPIKELTKKKHFGENRFETTENVRVVKTKSL